jgi:hypothetical protein
VVVRNPDYDSPHYWQREIIHLNERQKLLEAQIEALQGAAYPHHPDSLMLWYRYTERGTLPYAGGWLEQPSWWLEDVWYFELLEERALIPYRLAQAQENIGRALERKR